MVEPVVDVKVGFQLRLALRGRSVSWRSQDVRLIGRT
jgi:hypothetical protein